MTQENIWNDFKDIVAGKIVSTLWQSDERATPVSSEQQKLDKIHHSFLSLFPYTISYQEFFFVKDIWNKLISLKNYDKVNHMFQAIEECLGFFSPQRGIESYFVVWYNS